MELTTAIDIVINKVKSFTSENAIDKKCVDKDYNPSEIIIGSNWYGYCE